MNPITFISLLLFNSTTREGSLFGWFFSADYCTSLSPRYNPFYDKVQSNFLMQFAGCSKGEILRFKQEAGLNDFSVRDGMRGMYREYE
jgi:hypothetical protein